MGKTDIACKEYFRDNRIFADSFNYYVYNGEQVISPDRLQELDTDQLFFPFGDHRSSPFRERFRDSLKVLVAKTDHRAAYAILGIEEETNIGYNEPVKVMVYDAMHYSQQIRKVKKSYSQSHNIKSDPGESHNQRQNNGGKSRTTARKLTSAEFISGFSREDRLVPVITLVVSFSGQIWDGPTTLHEMLQETDPRLLAYVPDYRINLIDPHRMSKKDFDRFQSELGLILACVNASADKDKLQDVINDERYSRISLAGARVLEMVTGRKLFKKKAEVIDVCKGLQDLIDDERKVAEAERQRANSEMKRAESEKERADEALKLAASEKQRADELAAELEALKKTLSADN